MLNLYLSFPYVQRAIIVGVLIALCSSLLGVTLVLKRFSYIGDGLSHVAFGAMAVAGILRLSNDMLLVLPITMISAILLLRSGRNTRIKGDAAIAMISVGALAVGYLLLNLFHTSGNLSGDVCTTLFGSMSILTLRPAEVWPTGTRADAYNLLIATVIAVIIVMAMNLVGSLLISALIIFPAMAAMRLFKSFRSVTICSAVLSVCCALAGLLISILAGTPVGSTIVAADIAAFLTCCGIAKLQRRTF